MRGSVLLAGLFAAVFSVIQAQAEIVQFKAADGLTVTADLQKGASNKVIVLFHQAGSSRGEYDNIAPRLNEFGYTTLAVDQRSGGGFGGVANETAKAAAKAGKGVSFVDAKPDLVAAINYVRKLPGIDKVAIWGSSYSASLVLVIAGEGKHKVDGVLSFSPGEYLRGVSVEEKARGIKVPTFISASKSEARQWQPIIEAIPASTKSTGFIPAGRGAHGSSALNSARTKNAGEYWDAVQRFLKRSF